MKNQDVQVGGDYEVRVSGALVVCAVLRQREVTRYRYSRRVGVAGEYTRVIVFDTTNLRTGRAITLRASRLRRLLGPTCGCSPCRQTWIDTGRVAPCAGGSR